MRRVRWLIGAAVILLGTYLFGCAVLSVATMEGLARAAAVFPLAIGAVFLTAGVRIVSLLRQTDAKTDEVHGFHWYAGLGIAIALLVYVEIFHLPRWIK